MEELFFMIELFTLKYDKGDYDKVFIVLKNVLKKFMERKQR